MAAAVDLGGLQDKLSLAGSIASILRSLDQDQSSPVVMGRLQDLAGKLKLAFSPDTPPDVTASMMTDLRDEIKVIAGMLDSTASLGRQTVDRNSNPSITRFFSAVSLIASQRELGREDGTVSLRGLTNIDMADFNDIKSLCKHERERRHFFDTILGGIRVSANGCS